MLSGSRATADEDTAVSKEDLARRNILQSNNNTNELSISEDSIAYPKVITRMRSISDRYIIVFSSNSDPGSIKSHFSWLNSQISYSGHGLRQRVFKKFDGRLIKGYSGTFLRSFVYSIAKRPEIDYVESEVIFHAVDVQQGAPYNLARLSHRETLTNETESTFGYDSDPGAGVTVYILDTGIVVDHEVET